MRAFLPAAGLVALCVLAAPVSAGPIERACLASDRNAASRTLCGCIQQAADMTLRSADQRRAAAFFKDPDRAQQVRMSKTDADNAFWERYKNFSATAEGVCAG